MPADARSPAEHRQSATGLLGERMHCAGIVLKGRLAELKWIELLRDVAHAIGMEAVGEPKVWTYPFEGKGGQGQTILLPITESFLALDTWSDHDGAYLLVCSCREFFTRDIDDVAKKAGLSVDLKPQRRFYNELELT